jgi:hypothetical protein
MWGCGEDVVRMWRGCDEADVARMWQDVQGCGEGVVRMWWMVQTKLTIQQK